MVSNKIALSLIINLENAISLCYFRKITVKKLDSPKSKCGPPHNTITGLDFESPTFQVPNLSTLFIIRHPAKTRRRLFLYDKAEISSTQTQSPVHSLETQYLFNS